jgi:hypothetical protein
MEGGGEIELPPVLLDGGRYRNLNTLRISNTQFLYIRFHLVHSRPRADTRPTADCAPGYAYTKRFCMAR